MLALFLGWLIPSVIIIGIALAIFVVIPGKAMFDYSEEDDDQA